MCENRPIENSQPIGLRVFLIICSLNSLPPYSKIIAIHLLQAVIFIQPQGYYQPYTPIIDMEKQQTSQARKNLFRIGLGLLIYLLITSAVQATAMFLCSRFLPQIYLQDWFTVACSLLGYAAGLPILFGFITAMPKQAPQKQRLGFSGCVAFLASSILLLELGSTISNFLMSCIESIKGQEIPNIAVDQYAEFSPLVNFLVVVVLAPIFEELIFRKWIIDRLLPYSETLAVVTSGLLFGLIHGNFYQFFYAVSLGLLFASVYIRTGNLWHTIGMHAFINFIGSTITFFFNERLTAEADSAIFIGPWSIVATVYSLALMVLAICGVFFLLRRLKTERFSKSGSQGLSLACQFKAAWLNWGSILLIGYCLLLFLASIII